MNYSRDNKGRFDTKGVENVMEWVKRCNPDMEYEGGFVNFDSPILIRCTKCGDIFSRSMVSIRHGRKTICKNCQAIRMEASARQHAEDIARQRAERHAQVVLARERLVEARRHECPVCGASTTRRKYCSNACADKADHTTQYVRRRTRIEGQMIDCDITLEGVYRKDGGICWICGTPCDWGDIRRSGRRVAIGNSYPTIDHVAELSKGGAHAWDNVRLAHMGCNSKRFWGHAG